MENLSEQNFDDQEAPSNVIALDGEDFMFCAVTFSYMVEKFSQNPNREYMWNFTDNEKVIYKISQMAVDGRFIDFPEQLYYFLDEDKPEQFPNFIFEMEDADSPEDSFKAIFNPTDRIITDLEGKALKPHQINMLYRGSRDLSGIKIAIIKEQIREDELNLPEKQPDRRFHVVSNDEGRDE